MNDRGEKIVSLASEILRGERGYEAFSPTTCTPPDDKKSPLKAALIAALLAATGATLSGQAIHEIRRPATRYERVEIDALLFYTARKSGRDEAKLRDDLQAFFALSSLRDLSAVDYKRIRHYLWLQLDEQAARKAPHAPKNRAR